MNSNFGLIQSIGCLLLRVQRAGCHLSGRCQVDRIIAADDARRSHSRRTRHRRRGPRRGRGGSSGPRSSARRSARWRTRTRSRSSTGTAPPRPSSRSSPTSRACGRRPRARCERAATAGRSRGRSTRRCPFPPPSRCGGWPRARSWAATTGAAGEASRRPRGVERFVICGGPEELAPRRRPRGARRAVDERRPGAGRRARRTWSRRRDSPSARRRFRTSASTPSTLTRQAWPRSPPSAGAARARPLLLVLRHEPAGRARGTAACARRQGGHVRHRRLLPQAAVGHRAPEGRHGGRRSRRRRRSARSRSSDCRCRSPGSCRPARTC